MRETSCCLAREFKISIQPGQILVDSEVSQKLLVGLNLA